MTALTVPFSTCGRDVLVLTGSPATVWEEVVYLKPKQAKLLGSMNPEAPNDPKEGPVDLTYRHIETHTHTLFGPQSRYGILGERVQDAQHRVRACRAGAA